MLAHTVHYLEDVVFSSPPPICPFPTRFPSCPKPPPVEDDVQSH